MSPTSRDYLPHSSWSKTDLKRIIPKLKLFKKKDMSIPTVRQFDLSSSVGSQNHGALNKLLGKCDLNYI